MKKNYPLILLYALINFATLCVIALVTMLFYGLELGRGLEYGTSKYVSHIVLAIFAVLGTITAILNWKYRRKSTSVVVNVFVPLAVLNTIVLFKRTGYVALWCIGFGVAVPLLIMLFKRYSEKLAEMPMLEKLFPSCYEEAEEERVKSTSATNGIWSGIVSSFIVLFFISTLTLGFFGVFESHYFTYCGYNDICFSETHISAEDMQEFSKIDSKSWEKLSVNERLDVLQRVSDREAYRLGIPLPPKVETAELYNNFYNVNFNADTNTIEVDFNMVKFSNNGYKAVQAVAHGSFYAYENAKSDLVEYLDSPVEYNVPPYSCLVDFWDNKVNNEFSFEENSKKYAELAVAEYRRKIFTYKFTPNNQKY